MTLGPALQIFIYAYIAEGSVNSRRVVPERSILPPFIIYLNQNCIGHVKYHHKLSRIFDIIDQSLALCDLFHCFSLKFTFYLSFIIKFYDDKHILVCFNREKPITR